MMFRKNQIEELFSCWCWSNQSLCKLPSSYVCY